jgi:hypothetical protein
MHITLAYLTEKVYSLRPFLFDVVQFKFELTGVM